MSEYTQLSLSARHSSERLSPEDIPVIVYGGRRVVTTALLAKLYGTQETYITRNFQRNTDRFVPGKHFHKLEGADLKAFKDYASERRVVDVPPQTRHFILWTERGAARHAKMLDTDKAWDVFEKLEDCYFNQVEQSAPASSPVPAPAAHTSPAFLDLRYNRRPLRITRLAGGIWYGSSGVARALGWRDSGDITRYMSGIGQMRVVPHKGRALMVIDHPTMLEAAGRARPEYAARFLHWLGQILRRHFGDQAPALPSVVDPLERVTGDGRQLAIDYLDECRQIIGRSGERLPVMDAEAAQRVADGLAAQLVANRRWVLSFDGDGLPVLKGLRADTVLLRLDDREHLAQLLREQVPADALPEVLDAGLRRLGTLALPSR